MTCPATLYQQGQTTRYLITSPSPFSQQTANCLFGLYTDCSCRTSRRFTFFTPIEVKSLPVGVAVLSEGGSSGFRSETEQARCRQPAGTTTVISCYSEYPIIGWLIIAIGGPDYRWWFPEPRQTHASVFKFNIHLTFFIKCLQLTPTYTYLIIRESNYREIFSDHRTPIIFSVFPSLSQQVF